MKHVKTIGIAAFIFVAVSASAQQKKISQQKPVKKVVTVASTSTPGEDRNADFLQRNPTIKSVKWEPGLVLILEKADGAIERYMVDNVAEEEKVKSLYGKLPPFPTPVKSTTAPTSWKPDR